MTYDVMRDLTGCGRHLAAFGALLLWCSELAATAAETQPTKTTASLPAKEQFHLYLLMGQSNMAGRGAIEQEDQTPHAYVLMLDTNATWQIAIEPVTHDRPTFLGVGPGLAFGKAMAGNNPGVTIGLVPCAVGGTPLKRWQKGGDLYSNAVHRAQIAGEAGTLKGVLWHQGENDSDTEASARSYGGRLANMIQDLRADLHVPELPFVVGQLGEFLSTNENKSPFARTVSKALAQIPQAVPHTGCVSATGLGHKGDEVHFDTASQRDLGRRYAATMRRLQDAQAKPR